MIATGFLLLAQFLHEGMVWPVRFVTRICSRYKMKKTQIRA